MKDTWYEILGHWLKLSSSQSGNCPTCQFYMFFTFPAGYFFRKLFWKWKLGNFRFIQLGIFVRTITKRQKTDQSLNPMFTTLLLNKFLKRNANERLIICINKIISRVKCRLTAQIGRLSSSSTNNTTIRSFGQSIKVTCLCSYYDFSIVSIWQCLNC